MKTKSKLKKALPHVVAGKHLPKQLHGFDAALQHAMKVKITKIGRAHV